MPLSDITPMTWTDGTEDLTDVNLNTEIRDSYNLQLLPPSVSIRRTTTQTIATSTWTGIGFDTLEYDTLATDTPQWASGSNTKLTCQVNGWYEIIGSGTYNSPSARGIFVSSVRLNGVTDSTHLYHGSSMCTNGTTFGTLDYSYKNLLALNSGDFIEFYVWQNSGANQTLNPDYYTPVFSMTRRRGL